MANCKRFSLYLAWLIALIALLASLYASEILGYEPCKLCWYQRICLFPLSFILGIAVYKDNREIGVYVWPLLVIGAFFALFQEFYPYWNRWGNALCGNTSCSEVSYVLLSIPLPYWSFISFIGIGILLLVAYSDKSETVT